VVLKKTVKEMVVIKTLSFNEEMMLLKLLIKLPTQLLAVSSLVVLKPIEHILAFNLSIQRKMGSNMLNLSGIGSLKPISINLLQNHHLLGGRTPP